MSPKRDVDVEDDETSECRGDYRCGVTLVFRMILAHINRTDGHQKRVEISDRRSFFSIQPIPNRT